MRINFILTVTFLLSSRLWAAERIIDFSGYQWKVRSAQTAAHPGPNVFSDSPKNVWVDEFGHLHLKITHFQNKWESAELMLVKALGFGTYSLTMGSPVSLLDDQSVFGFFTWDDRLIESHREMDIELSTWAKQGNQNAQFVVVPTAQKTRFQVSPTQPSSTYGFEWSPGRVIFDGDGVGHWDYVNKAVPSSGQAKIQLNLWLFKGEPPASGREIEVVIDAFSFRGA